MSYREVIARLEREGWYLARQNGSHRIYRHNDKSGIVIVAPHSLGDKVPAGTTGKH
ncbi:MAG: type II toxin-antitoxin system HicA family toxin [Fimbriimonas sp.]